MYNYLCVHVQVDNLHTEPLITRFTGGIVGVSGINIPVSIHSLIKANHHDNVCFIEKMRKREQILMGMLMR